MSSYFTVKKLEVIIFCFCVIFITNTEAFNWVYKKVLSCNIIFSYNLAGALYN